MEVKEQYSSFPPVGSTHHPGSWVSVAASLIDFSLSLNFGRQNNLIATADAKNIWLFHNRDHSISKCNGDSHLSFYQSSLSTSKPPTTKPSWSIFPRQLLECTFTESRAPTYIGLCYKLWAYLALVFIYRFLFLFKSRISSNLILLNTHSWASPRLISFR